MKNKKIEFSVVMPCLNEERTLGICIDKIRNSFKGKNIDYEIIVADNGSTDNSLKIAKRKKAEVVNIKHKGYGYALQGGIQKAKGKYIIMGDSDDSYDFSKLAPFIKSLREGNDLVMGNRFAGEIKPGSMPMLHKLIGNPAFSLMGRIFFNSTVGDFYCGLRGFSKEAWKKMYLQATGMEYAIEMVIKASLSGMKVVQIPIVLHKDGRKRPPHLKTWQDGWRTLRFILLFAPAWLFYLPGLIVSLLGFLLYLLAAFHTYKIFGLSLDVHTLLVASAFMIVGIQIILFGLFAKIMIFKLNLLPLGKKRLPFLTKINTGYVFLASILFIIVGVLFLFREFYNWYLLGFGPLDFSTSMRVVIPSVFLIQLGIQLFFNIFFLDVLLLPSRKD